MKKNSSKMREDVNGSGTTNQIFSFPTIVGCIVVAALSFLAGVFTPDFMSIGEVANALVSSGKFLGLGTVSSHLISKCTEESLSHFLHEKFQRGMHVVCIDRDVSNGNLNFKMFKGAQHLDPKDKINITISSEDALTWSNIQTTLKDALNLRTTDALHQPWAVFNDVGEKLATEGEVSRGDSDEEIISNLVGAGLLIIFQGGQWLWPGVRVGYARTIDLYSVMPGYQKGFQFTKEMENKTAILETLSLEPLVLSVNTFLSEDECNHIQAKASPHMQYSGVSLTDADQGKPADEFRTSQSTFVGSINDPMMLDIDYRTASLVRLPRSHQEYVQVLRYGYDERYVAHHDYFNAEIYTKDPGTLRTIQNGRRNRLATVFWYLSDVEEGGETIFPRHNGLPQPRDFGDCSVGLKVKPQRGKVIIFYSLTADGALDPLSLHGACKVKKGIKWAANKWVWNAPMEYIHDA